jgi:hypothetical protein
LVEIDQQNALALTCKSNGGIDATCRLTGTTLEAYSGATHTSE